MISQASILPGTKRASERGQISIFFASSLIVLISIIAFVINIGLFVKAKINLQNAVDAGAYAGAAVQARMLTRIGYMNWEMRNNYKEWMFKYYVLGNLNINDVETAPSGSDVSYRMLGDPNLPPATGSDIYNFPSVCIHYAGVPTNVCKRYAVPGIPRFEPTNLVGIDETTSSFIDAIVKEKSSDCSKRTQLNFNVTNMWAYNISKDISTGFADAPQIAADRPGAWPKAVELAIRTRSLEFAMNRAPITQGICTGGQGEPGCIDAAQLGSEQNYGNERPAKAFWSAYRNISNQNDSEMKPTFTLKELAPTQVTFPSQYSLSNMLMSPDAKQAGKYYLDLKIMMVNYATFFTALIARNDAYAVGGQNVKSEGACDVSKIAIPVPGYPLGFYKNPDVLTYYAVKGTAKFNGLFNPFANSPVMLTAWAAAKPMGGRIGPALFRASSETLIASRTTATKKRSTAYLSGLDLANVPVKGGGTPTPGKYYPGMPIPLNPPGGVDKRFWVTEATDDVGGWINGSSVVFGIPNMVYDFDGGSPEATSYQIGNVDTNIIVPSVSGGGSYASGLYKTSQFSKFRANLIGTNDPTEIARSITRVRAPTTYEAGNYTVPVPSALSVNEDVEGAKLDTFGFINGQPESEGRRFALIYAPLYGPNADAMFKNGQDVVGAIKEFIYSNEGAMKKYRDSMNRVALSIYQADPSKYIDAAKRISDFDFNQPPDAAGSNPQTCNSITGNFLHFYFNGNTSLKVASPAGCPKPLEASIEEYFTAANGEIDPLQHGIEYVYDAGNMQGLQNYSQLLTGYMPGPLRGATNTGQFTTPFQGADTETMRRTGYSAKLVTLKSLTNGGGYSPGSVSPFAIYSEGLPTPLNEDVKQTALRNALDITSAGVPATITH